MKKSILSVILILITLSVLIIPAAVSASNMPTQALPEGIYIASPVGFSPGREVTLSATLAVKGELPTSIKLFYAVDGAAFTELSAPIDETTRTSYKYRSEDHARAVYRADIPSAAMKDGAAIKWYFAAAELVSEVKTTVVGEGGRLPSLLISEICANPKGADSNSFIEITNISNSTVDLGNYSLAYAPEIGGLVSRRFDLCDTTGKYLLESGRSAVVWFINTATYKAYSAPKVDNFLAKCKSDGISVPSDTMVLPIDTTALIGGVRVTSAKFFILEPSELMQLYLIEKGKYSTESTCSAVLNRDGTSLASDGNSSLYALSRDGSNTAKQITIKSPTPGTLDASLQMLPELSDSRLPAVAYSPTLTNTRDFSIYVNEDSRIEEIVLIYKTDTMTEYSELEMTAMSNGFYGCSIDDRLLESSSKLSYSFRISDGGNTVTVDGETERTVEDFSGPRVVSSAPENYYYYENVYTPSFSAEYTDRNGICSYSLKLDDQDITDKAVWQNGKVKYDGSVKVEAGEHIFTLRLVDNSANRNVSEFTIRVFCGDARDLRLYCGELHAHTSYSDGVLTPEVAYDYARYVGGVDFFAITDHSDSLTDVEWLDIMQTADAKNEPGEYVALWGYEQTYNTDTGWYGHLNAFNTVDYSKRSLALRGFYKYLSERPGSLGQFNHPGTKWGNFCDYGYWDPAYDEFVRLYEMKGSGYDYEYMLCLNRGWHVGPAHNEDNHSANWTTANEATTYVLSPSLTRANIYEALQKNRSYSTTDGTLKIYYKINDEWMGAKLKSPSKLNVSIELSTEKSAGIGTVMLMGEDNTVIASKNFGANKKGVWKFSIDPNYEYYYVRVTQGSNYAVTAPIWIEERNALEIVSLDTALANGETSRANIVTATVKNTGKETLNNINISFYQSSSAAHYLATASLSDPSRAESLAIGSLKPGESATVEMRLSGDNGKRRISAVVRGESLQGESYGSVETIVLSPLYITEAGVASSGGNYDFIELYNNTNQTLSLNSYKLRIWPSAGSEAKTVSLAGYSIPARSTLVLWFRPDGSTMMIKDFNKYYGVSLTDNQLKIINGYGALADKSQQIDIYQTSHAAGISDASNVVSRIDYNLGESLGKDNQAGKSIAYQYSKDISVTMTKIVSNANPTPGSVMSHLIPALRTADSVVTISSTAEGVYNSLDAVKKAEAVVETPGVYAGNPDSGDGRSDLSLAIGVMVISAVSAVVVVLIKNKRRKAEK